MNNQHNNFEDNQDVSTNQFNSSTPSKEELDSIEYILPVPSDKKRHKKAKHKHKTADTKSTDNIDDFVYAQPYSKKHARKKKGLKIFGIIMGVIAALLVVCVSTLLIFNQVGKSAMHNYDDLNIEPPVEQIDKIETVENDGKTIKYNGSTYTFNEKVTSVVLMGIDIDENDPVDAQIGNSGQADAIYIAVMDTSKSKVTILGVSRDTMTDVNVYNVDGDFVNTQFLQLCLSYAYGDGEHTSCQNTLTSLQRIFYGMQFNTYFSMDIPAIEKLTDAVGGVSVTLQSDFYSNYYGCNFSKGETITLYGDDAISYIRSRDITELDSNNDRMARQKQFMTAFLAKCFDSIKSDPSTVVDLYKTVDDNSTTNLNASKMTYLASTAIAGLDSYKDVEFVNVPGTVKKGEFAEFYADENALMDIMLDLFYVKVQ